MACQNQHEEQPIEDCDTPTGPCLKGGNRKENEGAIAVTAAVAASFLVSFVVLVACLAVVVWLVVPASLLLVVAGLVKRKRRWCVTGCFATVVAVSGTVAGWLVGTEVHRAQCRKSCERGDALAAALERYRSTHGSYHAQLEELVPSFLSSLPVTCIGLWPAAPFHYEWFREHKYELTFAGSVFDLWIRRSDGTWSCD